jgi:preprotein translocase subunit SecG
MVTIFNIAMIIISILLVSIILIQVKGTGSALFGAAESSYRTRRGLELALFRFTIMLSVAFILVAIVSAWVATNN